VFSDAPFSTSPYSATATAGIGPQYNSSLAEAASVSEIVSSLPTYAGLVNETASASETRFV
jgi:hypothetical protein